MNHVHLHGLNLLFMKITQLYVFTQNSKVLTNTRSFRNVFVDCVVLG